MSRPAGAEEEAMAVITIQGLTKRFGQVVAVDNLSSSCSRHGQPPRGSAEF
jgi:hypothetical protein